MRVHYHKQLYVYTCHTYVVGLSDSSQITIMITSCKPFMIRNTGMCPGLGEWWLHKEV